MKAKYVYEPDEWGSLQDKNIKHWMNRGFTLITKTKKGRLIFHKKTGK
jgi:hypothetical protein